jgi:hypothetical protein
LPFKIPQPGSGIGAEEDLLSPDSRPLRPGLAGDRLCVVPQRGVDGVGQLAPHPCPPG